jgi:hypothetical protein
MRKSFTIVVLLCAFATIHAQETEFSFRNNLKDTLKLTIDYANSGNHALGGEVARKFLLMKETYTYVEAGTPMAPGDKTIIKKPDIYYAVKKLNAYYKKAVKKGLIDQEKAAKNMISVVEKSFSIFYEDTKKFEEYIRTIKNPEDIQKAFDNIKLF